MKRLALTAAAAIVAAPAFALVDFETVDVNADDFISLPEALSAYPSMDPTQFDEIDADDNRQLDVSEAQSAAGSSIFDGLERADAAAAAAAFDTSPYDTDADGLISFAEISNVAPNVPEVYFRDFDTDNSGSLDSAELETPAFQYLLDRYGS